MSAGVIDTMAHHISLLELAVEAADTESPLVEVSEVTVTSPVATPQNSAPHGLGVGGWGGGGGGVSNFYPQVAVTSPVATPSVMSFMTEHNAKSGKSQTKYCRLLATNTGVCRASESLMYSTV